MEQARKTEIRSDREVVMDGPTKGSSRRGGERKIVYAANEKKRNLDRRGGKKKERKRKKGVQLGRQYLKEKAM